MINEAQIKKLELQFPQLKFEHNFPLSSITYFKVGGPAKIFVRVKSLEDLIDIIRYCQKQELEYVLLGGASNVVVVDEGVNRLVIVTDNSAVELLNLEGNQPVTSSVPEPNSCEKKIIRAECGTRTALLVKKSIEFGLTGLESFMGVPGKVGGAIFNNSHFQTDLIGDFISQVEVLNTSGERVWLDQSQCQFDYDYSRFQESGEVILRADFLLSLGDEEQSKQLVSQTMNYRVQTQPLGMPSSGCIFKNVENSPELKKLFPQFAHKKYLSAGFLIDRAGLKRSSEGGIQVSDKHASFMVNTGAGQATDIKKLVKRVKSEVNRQFGVELREEIFWIK